MSADITRRSFAGAAAWLALGAAARAQGFAGLEEKADGFARVTPAAAFPFPVITVRTTISASSGGM
jgi:hypothetical protein